MNNIDKRWEGVYNRLPLNVYKGVIDYQNQAVLSDNLELSGLSDSLGAAFRLKLFNNVVDMVLGSTETYN